MNLMFLLWIAIGAATGASHAAALWRTAHGARSADWSFPWRLPVVAITLVISALVGRLVPAAIGWAAGLVLTGVGFLVSKRRWM